MARAAILRISEQVQFSIFVQFVSQSVNPQSAQFRCAILVHSKHSSCFDFV